MIRKFWVRWRSAGWGLLSQASTLIATVLPVIWGLQNSLVILVVATAIATICTPIATLAAQYRIPLSRSPVELMRRSVVSVVFTLALSVTVGLLVWTITSGASSPEPLEWSVAVGLLTGAQGVFTIAIAVLIRANAYGELMFSRFAYGLSTLGFTVVALLSGGDGLVLCIAVAGGYVVGAILAVKQTARLATRRGLLLPKVSLTGGWRHIWESRTLAIAGTVGALAGQFGALAAPMLGAVGVSWAAAIRTMSGFQTIGVVVLGSAIDADISGSLRRRDRSAAQRVTKRAVKLGLGIGAAGTVVTLMAAWFVSTTEPAVGAPLAIAIVFYCGTSIALSPIGRILGLAGKGRARLSWDLARCVLFGGAVLVPSPSLMLIAFGLVGAFGYISYAMLLRRVLSRTED